ncbi:MAG TPA: MlaD family protein [Thermoleophilaceae bacterium]|nr:MlaD family protein [Thermoleophilaceae bacterium]
MEAGQGKAMQPAARRPSGVARIAALAAVLAAATLTGLLLFGGGDGYTVTARFINAGQLVKGNLVDVGGTRAGVVKDFEITANGQADVVLQIDEKYAPLRHGTRAVIRQGGQASPANRYVQLMLPPEPQAGNRIRDGGRIGIEMTTTNVDLDQFFNIFDRPTRKALQDFYKGGQRQYAGRAEAANRGLRYLSPQLAASSRLFAELRHDPPVLERFLVDSSRFVTALSSRRDDLSALIANLNSTTRGLGSEEAALSEAITRFPPFLRQANSTYVNLRAALDDLDPLVNASKPVARKLRPYLGELRPLARDAVPTVRNLRRTVRRAGGANDLRELQQTYPKLEEVALVERRRNGAERRGAFPELSEALRGSAPIIAHGRPYTTDLFGWFDDFSHTGASDALGSFSRVQTYINAFTVQNGLPTNLIPLADRTNVFRSMARLRQVKRCPGGAEVPAADGTNVLSAEQQRELDCRESDRATGDLP